MTGCGGCSGGKSCQSSSSPHQGTSSSSGMMSPMLQHESDSRKFNYDEQGIQVVAEKIRALQDGLRNGEADFDEYELEILVNHIALDSFSSLSRLNQFYRECGIHSFLALLQVLNSLNIRGHFCLWYFEYCRKRLLLDDQDLPFSPTDLNHILGLQEYFNEQACIFKAFNSQYEFTVYPRL